MSLNFLELSVFIIFFGVSPENRQHFLTFGPADPAAINLPIVIRSKQAPQPVVGKPLVNRSHGVLREEDCSSNVHFSVQISSLFNFNQHLP